MTHKILYTLPFLAGLISFSACSTDTDVDDVSGAGNRVVISAAIGNGNAVTRSNPLGDAAGQADFSKGDVIRISKGSEPVDYVLRDGGWEPSVNDKYLVWEDEVASHFDAYYPIGEGNSFTSGKIPTDQSNLEKVESADFMTAQKTENSTPGNRVLSLAFARQTARVIIKLDGVSANDIENFKIIGATSTPATQSTAKEGITPYTTTDGSYVALVGAGAPADDGSVFISLDYAGTSMTVTGIPAFEAGKSYTYVLTVSNDLRLRQVAVEDWYDEGVISGDTYTMMDNPSLNLGTDVSTADELTAWLEKNNLSKFNNVTLTLSGTWKDDYYEPLRTFLSTNYRCDMTLDLSQVQGLTEIKGPGVGFSAGGDYGLAGIILPPTVERINNQAFIWSRLKAINLSNVTYIGDNAFCGTLIEDITIPAAIENVPFGMLQSTSKLKTVTFEGDVKSFGEYVFESTNALTTIDLSNCTSVPTISDTFNYATPGNITVLVKDETMKTAFENDDNWKSVGLKGFKVKTE